MNLAGHCIPDRTVARPAFLFASFLFASIAGSINGARLRPVRVDRRDRRVSRAGISARGVWLSCTIIQAALN
jgi:hypothetical protein